MFSLRFYFLFIYFLPRQIMLNYVCRDPCFTMMQSDTFFCKLTKMLTSRQKSSRPLSNVQIQIERKENKGDLYHLDRSRKKRTIIISHIHRSKVFFSTLLPLQVLPVPIICTNIRSSGRNYMGQLICQENILCM